MTETGIEKWAKKLIQNHTNPIQKLHLHRTKLFLPSDRESEAEQVRKLLENVKNALAIERVDKRCARAVADWIPEQTLGKVRKSTGALSNFIFANKDGLFLYPEYIMFLLETNRLELFCNKVPVSIQQAYEMILNASSCSLGKYISFRHLALQGFRILTESHSFKHECSGEPSPKKLRIEGASASGAESLLKVGESERDYSKTEERFDEDIFEKLQKFSPKKYEFTQGVEEKPEYRCFLPENSTNLLPSFNLKVCEDKYLDSNIGFLTPKISTIIAYTDLNFVGYFQIINVDVSVP